MLRRRLNIEPNGVPCWPLSARLSLALLTGFLWFAAYPPLHYGPVIWFAFVPLLVALSRTGDLRSALRLSYLAGAVYWLATMFWLTRVTAVGWCLLSLYTALYLLPFALILYPWLRGGCRFRAGYQLVWILLAAWSWGGLEYVRGTLFTGFGWNPLAAALTGDLPVLQLADLGGTPLVSSLVMLVNLAVSASVIHWLQACSRRRVIWSVELLAVLPLMMGAVVYGHMRIQTKTAQAGSDRFSAALIQPNIPQYIKWSPEFIADIYDKLKTLSAAALTVGDLDLVIWPETAVPAYLRESPAAYEVVMATATQGVPLLAGAMDFKESARGLQYYNSSFLFDGDGRLTQVYDKQHLVLLGEYIPFHDLWPEMFNTFAPIETSFSAGRTATIFRVENQSVSFAALICFEDTVPSLSRRAVRNGARLLINQTNDAWFDPYWGSAQHLLHSVLRAVESGVPVLRAANSGVSCAVLSSGRILEMLHHDGDVRVEGFKIVSVPVPSEEAFTTTFYHTWGDIWGISGVAAWCVGLVASRRRRRITTDE